MTYDKSSVSSSTAALAAVAVTAALLLSASNPGFFHTGYAAAEITETIEPNATANHSLGVDATPSQMPALSSAQKSTKRVALEVRASRERALGFRARILNASGEEITAANVQPELEVEENKAYDLEVLPETRAIKKVRLFGVNLSKGFSLRLEDLDETKLESEYGLEIEQAYAVDPASIEFDHAELAAVARGDALLKCVEWNFEEQRCSSPWAFYRELTPGSEYALPLSQEDPAFIETNTTTKLCTCQASGSAGQTISCSQACAFNLTVPEGATNSFIQQMNYSYSVRAEKTQSGGIQPSNKNHYGIFDRDSTAGNGNEAVAGSVIQASAGALTQTGVWSAALTNANGFNRTNCPTWSSGYCEWYVRVNASATCGNKACLANTTVYNQTFTWNYSDEETPKYFDVTQNKTTGVQVSDSILFSAKWTDNLNLSSYVFEWNATGAFANDTPASFAGNLNYSNVTKIIPSSAANKTIAWRVYANDSSNNWNVTSTQSFYVNPVYGQLAVVLVSPTGTNSQPQNQTFLLKANVSCAGSPEAACGTVSGAARYNASTSEPDSAIQGNGAYATPFYATESNPQSCGEMNASTSACSLAWTVNATGNIGSSYKIDVNFTSSDSNVPSNKTDYATINIIAPTLSITISDALADVQFGSSLAPGSTNNPALNNSDNAYNITCDYLGGNCNVSIKANADMTSGVNVLGAGNVSWNQVNSPSTEKALAFYYNVVNATLPHLATQFIYFWIDVPAGQPAGAYKSNFTIKGEPS